MGTNTSRVEVQRQHPAHVRHGELAHPSLALTLHSWVFSLPSVILSYEPAVSVSLCFKHVQHERADPLGKSEAKRTEIQGLSHRVRLTFAVPQSMQRGSALHPKLSETPAATRPQYMYRDQPHALACRSQPKQASRRSRGHAVRWISPGSPSYVDTSEGNPRVPLLP
eukprot:scaffold7429_cov417-Prasinococcus_capsulatus_cf.AAC.7